MDQHSNYMEKVMATCIPQFNFYNFYFSDNTTNSNNFQDYIEHFYKESDIDVIM